LPKYFSSPDFEYKLDMTYEETNGAAIAAHVVIFKYFKQLQIGGLLRPRVGADLYWTADSSGFVHLTQLGQFYHQLAANGRI
jgi:hypothetical protein